MRKSFIKLSFVLALGAFAGAASATDFGAGIGGTVGIGGNGFVGNGGGYSEAATVGGSMAQTGNYGTGVAVQFSSNEGNAYSSAGGFVSHDGVSSYTDGASHSAGLSGGFTAGNGSGNTAGAVGNDYSSNAWGSFDHAGFGVSLGAFAGIGGFTTGF